MELKRTAQPGEPARRHLRLLIMARCVICAAVCLARFSANSAEPWQSALEGMPLGAKVTELNRTNCVAIMLTAFQSNDVVKALIFMPGATDEFYMFRRARANLTNPSPTLLDAVSALTNQTFIRATFLPPLLLLHTDEDPIDPLIAVEHQPTASKLKQARFLPHAIYNDRDWDAVQPNLKKTLKIDIRPWRYSQDSWHFYRHSFAEWGLSGWEALEAAAFAGKTSFTIQRKRAVFRVDGRVRSVPKLDAFPY